MIELEQEEKIKYPLIQLKGKDYLEVKWRVVWFRKEHPDWTIETEVQPQNGSCLSKATIKDTSGRVISTAHKYEDKQGFGDYIEKSETGAIGRALALIGYGTQFAVEIEEGQRIVDAPIVRADHATNRSSYDSSDAGDFEIPYGKNKGKKIKEVMLQVLDSDLNYWVKKLEEKGEPPKGKLADYLNAIQAYITSQQPPEPGTDEEIAF